MKKIMLSALCAGLMFSAQADDAASAEQDVAASVETSFSGVYFGGGFHVMSFEDSVDYMYADNSNALSKRGTTQNISRSTMNRLGGTILLGVGKKMATVPFYLALEGMLDFAPRTTLRFADRTDLDLVTAGTGTITPYSLTVHRNGLVPSVGLRFAWTSDMFKALAYLKVAASFTKDATKYSMHNPSGKHSTIIKNSKVCPEIMIGIEKRVGNLGMRTEIGGAFGHGKKMAQVEGDNDPDKLSIKKKYTLNARVLFVWNVKAFH